MIFVLYSAYVVYHIDGSLCVEPSSDLHWGTRLALGGAEDKVMYPKKALQR